METMKETAANIAASAESGLEKTKAVVGEKVEKMKAHDPLEKEMAELKKQERIHLAELEKRHVMAHNASGGTHSYSVTGGVAGKPIGANQMSALPGHGSGEPAGNVVEGVVQSQPVGAATGTNRPSVAHNTHAGGGTNQGYGTGGGYA